MKILVLLTELFDAFGGIQTFNRCLVKAINDISIKNDCKVSVLVLSDCGKSQLASKYITSACVSYRGFNGNKFLFAFFALVMSFKSNIVLVGHINFSFLVVLIEIINKNSIKYLIVYGVEVWRKLSKTALSKFNKIISISTFTKEQVKMFNNIEEDKFLILPCTLDPFYGYDLVPTNQNETIFPKGKMLLMVSRLDTNDRCKNIDKVIEAMPLILKQVPDMFYVIVGDGSDRKRLEQLSINLDLRDKVLFAGRVSSKLLPVYYKHADIFVLPSTGEGFGIVFLEAMFYAKPCIGARAGAIPEVIEDGKTGFLVEPNKESLTALLVSLLNNDALMKEIGRLGKERLEKEFSFNSFKNRLEKVLCD